MKEEGRERSEQANVNERKKQIASGRSTSRSDRSKRARVCEIRRLLVLHSEIQTEKKKSKKEKKKGKRSTECAGRKAATTNAE
jgi:hypothetical protein